ncbi:zinc metalloproteinase nas-14 [Aedes albopictus]|uniref:Metalloendopeptidase n=1 Tax=Aedes albopictus TaxID=7160 RepID=A0ABM1YVC4_AEDAL
MKNLTVGALLLVVCAAVVNGLHYHPYEEISGLRDGDLLVKSDPTGLADHRENPSRWPDSTVPYLFDGSFVVNQQAIVTDAMQVIQDASCVRFTPKQDHHHNFVLITREASGCWSSLGMQGGQQQMNLDPRGCIQKGAVLHQLMHLLGFIHPDSRPDRDLYVKIQLNNVVSNEIPNFDKVDGFNDFGMTYDYESILHRSGLAFTATGGHTIVPLHEDIELGQRETLSIKDIRKINKMYCIEVPLA